MQEDLNAESSFYFQENREMWIVEHGHCWKYGRVKSFGYKQTVVHCFFVPRKHDEYIC